MAPARTRRRSSGGAAAANASAAAATPLSAGKAPSSLEAAATPVGSAVVVDVRASAGPPASAAAAPFSAARSASTGLTPAPFAPLIRRSGQEVNIDDLPEELLLKIFSELASLGPIVPSSDEANNATNGRAGGNQLVTGVFPFRTSDDVVEPHPGLRAYPFLGQVCRRWKEVLEAPEARPFLWREVVVDFGHELITAVHTPIAWSDARPSDAEFRDAFAATRLSASRVLDFVAVRASSVRRVALTNSEGYWSDEGDFVNLQQKHTFSLGHVGLLLGSVRATLEELRVSHCSDIFAGFNRGALGMVACCPKLKVLRIDDVHTRLERDAMAQLGRLTNLEELAVSVEDNLGTWAVGLDVLPEAWRSLTKLKKLELRGHVQLATLPRWLPELQALEELDLSGCCHCDLSQNGGGGVLQRCPSLKVVSLSGMRLSDPLPPPPPPPRQSEMVSAAALFGDVAVGVGGVGGARFGGNNTNSTLPAMQPRALAAAVEAADAAAAATAAAGTAAATAAAVPAPRAAALLPPQLRHLDRVPAEIRAALEAMARGPAGARAPAGGANLLAFLEQRRGGGGGGGGGPADGAALRAAAFGARDARGFATAAAREFAAVSDDMSDGDDDEEIAAAAAAAADAVAARTSAAAGAAARASEAARAAEADRAAAAAAVASAARALPDLSSLPLLEALNLSDNNLTSLPHFLPKLGRTLLFLDLSGNGGLRFPSPLVPGVLSSLPALRALDARGAHTEAGLGYWSEEKCASMRHLCALAKAGKRRRPYGLRVIFDKE